MLQSDTLRAWQIQLSKHFKYIWVIILWNLSESETETRDRLIKVFIFLHHPRRDAVVCPIVTC